MTPTQQLYNDILTTAVEGGINYWAAVSEYHWCDPDPDTPGKVIECEVASVRVHEMNETEDGYAEEGVLMLTVDLPQESAGDPDEWTPGSAPFEEVVAIHVW